MITLEKSRSAINSPHKHPIPIFLCLMLAICLFQLAAVPAHAASRCRCGSASFEYHQAGNQHTVICNSCRYSWSESHSFEYRPNGSQHTVICKHCKYSWLESHSYDDEFDVTCNICSAWKDFEDNAGNENIPVGDIGGMDDFAWRIYKIICYIAFPCAIISFASCGYKFLGSIFLGTYMSGGEVEKTKKQALTTALVVLLIFLIPSIFGTAIKFFERNAWKP